MAATQAGLRFPVGGGTLSAASEPVVGADFVDPLGLPSNQPMRAPTRSSKAGTYGMMSSRGVPSTTSTSEIRKVQPESGYRLVPVEGVRLYEIVLERTAGR